MNSNHTVISYRALEKNDLADINQVITNAVMDWPLTERLKRLSLAVLLYDTTDLAHYEGIVALSDQQIIGVALWDPEHPESLLHGLYVAPEYQSKGIGTKLIEMISERARMLGKHLITIKAERVSRGYFERLGLTQIPTSDEAQYPYLYRLELG